MPEITPPPVTPEAPTNPTAPVEPVAPVENPATPDPSINPVESEDDKEWEDALKEQYPDAKPAEKVEDKPADPAAVVDPNKPAEPATSAEPVKAEIDRAAIEHRMTQRQTQEAAEAIRSDVRAKMFPDEEIKDASGNVIKSATDLEQYEDPRTGQLFTKEAAEDAWRVHQQNQSSNRVEQDKQLDQITNTNLALKDEADLVKDQYGAFLDANPGLKKEIFDMYQNTLVLDPNTGIVTKAPVSLLKFYNTAMRPYIDAAKQHHEATQQAAQQQEAAKQAEEEKRRQTRADRSDIYNAGKTDTASEDDKEWAEAATAVFGPLKGN